MVLGTRRTQKYAVRAVEAKELKPARTCIKAQTCDILLGSE